MPAVRAFLIVATILITAISPLFLRAIGSSSSDPAALASTGSARNFALRASSNAAANANAVVVQVTAPTATPTPVPPPAAPPPPVVVVQPAPVPQPCIFTLGFADLRSRILAQFGDAVGACLENEHGNLRADGTPENLDTLQRTAGGLMVWQQFTNTMRFTNGFQTWVFSACGLQTRINTQTFVWETNPAIAAQATPAPGTCGLV